MYHSGLKPAAVIVGTGLLVSACAVPHNNVLIFGTQTKVGVDVGVAAEAGGIPDVTIGYKRREAVWMPLVMNEQNCETNSIMLIGSYYWCKTKTTALTDDSALNAAVDGTPSQAITANDTSSKFMGYANGINTDRGGKNAELDTYSVFASLGAKVRGGGKDGASLGIAQFFATGIAAQRLGANPSAAQLVSVQPSSAEALAAQKARADSEKARADAAQDPVSVLQAQGLSREEAQRLYGQKLIEAAENSSSAKALRPCLENDAKREKLKEDSDLVEMVTTFENNVDDLIDFLTTDPVLRAKAEAICAQ